MKEIKDSFGLYGHVIVSAQEEGSSDWNKVMEFDNVITTQTKQIVMGFLQSGTGVFISHFGVGSGTVAESTGDSNNQYPVDITSAAASHKVFDSQINNGANVKFSAVLSTTEPSVQPVSLSEIGLFSAASGGSLFGHVTHSPYTKTNSVSLKYDYTVGIK